MQLLQEDVVTNCNPFGTHLVPVWRLNKTSHKFNDNYICNNCVMTNALPVNYVRIQLEGSLLSTAITSYTAKCVLKIALQKDVTFANR